MAYHNDFGKWGETTAAAYLESKGYAIIARDWRLGHRDLDIIANKDGTLVIVEVKARSSSFLVSPEESVDFHKMRSLCIAANAYVKMNRINAPIRFDIVAITGNADNYSVNHIEDAFVPPVVYR